MGTVRALRLATRQAVPTLAACLEDTNIKNRQSSHESCLDHTLVALAELQRNASIKKLNNRHKDSV